MNGSGDEKPPAPPARLQGASQRVDMQTHKPLPSVPEEKKKKKLKYIFTGDGNS